MTAVDVDEGGARGAPAAEVRSMFARIAPTYDVLNRVLSARRDVAWRHAAVAAIDPGARRILDLCAGTGDLAVAIASARPQARVIAGDFCVEMLRGGVSKGLGSRVAASACDALRLPFADAGFDAITVAFGVRNFESLDAGLREMRRITRPGGQLIVLEFFRNASTWRDRPFQFYFRHVLPRLGRLISRDAQAYSYLPASVGRFVTRTEFTQHLARAGWKLDHARDFTLGITALVSARRTD
jgi:demethylmenaquinone methyltransferase/2-methoxy-6-polyprenyl-1,4-benzoquinol methylase